MSITMPTNTAVRATKSRTQEQYSADYAGLLATMKDLGLLRRRYLWYAVRSAILLGLTALGVVALFAFTPGPWLLLLAVGLRGAVHAVRVPRPRRRAPADLQRRLPQ